MNSMLLKTLRNIFIGILATSFAAFSQVSTQTISGFILDASKKPIGNVSIQIVNTNLYTLSDSLGFFSLKFPNYINSKEIYVSRVGFHSKHIGTHLANQIILEANTNLNETLVSAPRTAYWKKKMRDFEEAIFGTTKYAKSCKILNENDIVFNQLDDVVLEITFKDKLQFINNDLGYRVIVDLGKVRIANASKMYRSLAITTKSDYIFFEELQTSSQGEIKKWQKNRKEIFYDSFRGFLFALATNTYKKKYYMVNELGGIHRGYNFDLSFEIGEGRLFKPTISNILSLDSTTQLFTLTLHRPLIVFQLDNPDIKADKVFYDMPYVFSKLQSTDYTINFNKFGVALNLKNILINGYWGETTKLSTLLPENYFPKKE